jgi:hypothetical protein
MGACRAVGRYVELLKPFAQALDRIGNEVATADFCSVSTPEGDPVPGSDSDLINVERPKSPVIHEPLDLTFLGSVKPAVHGHWQS